MSSKLYTQMWDKIPHCPTFHVPTCVQTDFPKLHPQHLPLFLENSTNFFSLWFLRPCLIYLQIYRYRDRYISISISISIYLYISFSYLFLNLILTSASLLMKLVLPGKSSPFFSAKSCAPIGAHLKLLGCLLWWLCFSLIFQSSDLRH